VAVAAEERWANLGSAKIRASETARKTGNQMFGLMKMAERASAVQKSVTKVALIRSFPTFVSVSLRSTRTAYTTASEVVERAVPAVSDAFSVQPIKKYEASEATTNGPRNEVTPIPTDAFRRRRMYAG